MYHVIFRLYKNQVMQLCSGSEDNENYIEKFQDLADQSKGLCIFKELPNFLETLKSAEAEASQEQIRICLSVKDISDSRLLVRHVRCTIAFHE